MAGYTRAWVTCDTTGKRGYGTRRAAKEVVVALNNGARGGMRPYRCAACRVWHVGHLPGVVRSGEVSAADYYRDAS